MPPEFRPSERSKKKQEPLKPKEPRTLEDIVDDIMKDYRDKQRELGNVDNWGQPNEKIDRKKVKAWVYKNLPKLNDNAKEVKDRGKTKFSPNAPAESVSEAIGNKLKEKADTQKDKQKKATTPKTSGSPKSTSNPRERSSPGAMPSSKNERKERPVPKIKTNPSEVKKKKIRSPSVSPEGLSKVIGGKLKEKAEQLKDRTKAPTTSEPRTPTHSPKEKRSPQPKSPANRERKKRLDPQVKIPPLEVRQKKSMEKTDRTSDRYKKPSNKENKERLGPKLKMQPPEVRGEKITSKERLRELTNGEYSALKKKADFPQRMREAVVHQGLMKKYEGKERIDYGEIAKIAKNLDVDRETVSNWLTKGMQPRLYTYMNWSTPRSEAAEKVRKIQESNNGIRNSQDVQKRLDNYYLGPEERASKFHPREIKKMDKYFEFLDVYKDGGLHLEIAKEVGLSDSGAHAYIDGATPRLVELAHQIPSETPLDGYKWLPKKYEHGGHGGKWSDWIQVPEKVTDYKQVMDVIKQLKPLDNADMRRLEMKYGRDFTREEGFMHLLGTYVSDAKEPSSSTSASAYGLNLSTDKKWNKDFGEATRFHLGQIGIKSHQLDNIPAQKAMVQTRNGMKEISMKSQYHWTSENSIIVRWIRKTCLELEESAKTYQKIDGGWILKSPRNHRIAFMQGLSDGDGHTDKTNGSFSISTHSSHEFVSKLFESFGIKTKHTETYVRTKNREDFLRVADLPPYKYARTRLKDMEEEVKKIDKIRKRLSSDPLSVNEIDRILELRSQGLSYGNIREKVFNEYGYTLHSYDIWNIVKDNPKYKSNKRKEKKGA